MLIRRAEEKDIEQLNRLLFQVQKVHSDGRPDLFRPGAKKYTDGELVKIIRDDQRPVYVAVEGEQMFGYAFCVYETTEGSASQTDRKMLYIDDLCVDEACRGQRIGTRLYRHVLDTARNNGCFHVTLNVWRLNEPAMKFYEKCGMTPLKVIMEQVL